HWLVFFLACALLAIAPALRGGNRQIALAGLLALSAALLALLLGSISFNRFFGQPPSSGERRRSTRGNMVFALALGFVGSSPLWLGLLQLSPLPATWWSGLAGRDIYLGALAVAGGTAPQTLPLSLNPQATVTALLSGIPAVATLFAALYLPRPLVEKCLVVLLLGGGCQMLLAVMQFWSGPGSELYFGVASASGFVGSFANRNHLADFLVMLVPVWFFWFSQSVKDRGQHRDESKFGGKSALWLFYGFALLVVTLATLSRGALLSGALVLTGSMLLLGVKLQSRLSRRQRIALGVAAALFALFAIIGVGTERIGGRINKATVELDAQTRHNFTTATLEGAGAFWPWGSGAGTYESVFPRFQAADSLYRVEYAHNDYAQLVMELGLPGLLLALTVVGLIVAQFISLLRAYRAERRLTGELALRAWCGLGTAALLLHSVVEFNMHIPALALTAAFLLGVYLRPLHPGCVKGQGYAEF
ncbi:MAG: O-antigen ligase family protein, partial [Giesbergeria sp.]